MTSRRIFAALGLLMALLFAGDVFADPPIITTNPPALLLVASNTTVTLSISAIQTNTASVLSFQWRRNGANIPGTLTNFFANAVTTTYDIPNVRPSDGGAYSVAIFNADGAVNSMVTKLIVTNSSLVQGSDSFGGRVSLFDTVTIRAANTSATVESGEPRHGNVPGGKSIWYTWTPQQSGVWTIGTRGSTFDTTLSVYDDPNPDDTDVTTLTSSGQLTFENDDANVPVNYHNSQVTFTASLGQSYAIAVDGFYGANGTIVLNIFRQANGAVVGFVSQPRSQTVGSNATVILSASTDRIYTSYEWFRDGVAVTGTNFNINGSTNLTLTNFNFNATMVGQYQVRVFLNTNAVFSDLASLQLNSEDGSFNPNAIAVPKFREATDTGFVPHVHPLTVAVSGFTGTHTWTTSYASAESGEPNHCGKVGGSPWWFTYLAPDNGTLTVDANTTDYTNVLAVYTWPGSGDFAQLVPVACASTNMGAGHEVSSFSAANGTTYYLVVDGLLGGYGKVTLTYNLTPTPVTPAITTPPQSQTVAQGSNVTLTVTATGTPTPAYQWRTNSVKYSLQTSTSLTVTNFQAAKEGSYDVVVTNSAGSVTSSAAMLYLNSPLRFTNLFSSTTGSFSATLLGKATTNYIIQASTNLATTNWISILTNSSPYGIISFVDTNTKSYSNRFFRAK